MRNYEENRRLDDLMHGEEEKRRRSEEARRKKAEAERRRKEREEAKRKKAEAEKQRKEREERDKRREQSEKHRNIAESTKSDTENSFSPKPNNGGIMEQRQTPKRNHMEEYNSAIKEQDELLDTIHKFQWDNASTHTKAEAQAAKQMRDNVLAYKKKLEHDKVNANPADAHAYARGTGGVSDYDKGMLNAYGNIGDGLKAEQARKAASYNKGMQHALGGSEKTNTPNVASEDTGSRNEYYNDMINRAADDYLNEWGGKDTEEAKEAWAAYGEQVDGIVEQRDAYNRAAMGVDTTAVQGGGGSKDVSLMPMDDEPIYVGEKEQRKPVLPSKLSNSELDALVHEEGQKPLVDPLEAALRRKDLEIAKKQDEILMNGQNAPWTERATLRDELEDLYEEQEELLNPEVSEESDEPPMTDEEREEQQEIDNIIMSDLEESLGMQEAQEESNYFNEEYILDADLGALDHTQLMTRIQLETAKLDEKYSVNLEELYAETKAAVTSDYSGLFQDAFKTYIEEKDGDALWDIVSDMYIVSSLDEALGKYSLEEIEQDYMEYGWEAGDFEKIFADEDAIIAAYENTRIQSQFEMIKEIAPYVLLGMGFEKTVTGFEAEIYSGDVETFADMADIFATAMKNASYAAGAAGLALLVVPEPYVSKPAAAVMGITSFVTSYEADIWSEAASKMRELAEGNKSITVNFNALWIDVEESE